LAAYAGPTWPVREVLLLESHLGPTPRYDTVASWSVEP
jgi:2'-5' RNA ligase